MWCVPIEAADTYGFAAAAMSAPWVGPTIEAAVEKPVEVTEN